MVPRRSADRAGGAGGLANAIDQQLRLRGQLIVVAGSGIHMITSYPQVGPAVTALREAVDEHQDDPLADKLLAGVDDATDEVVGTFKLVLLIIAAAIALPIVLAVGWVALRLRRRRREEAEELAAQRDALNGQLISLGDDIRELDLEVEMPDAEPEGRADYERAVALYEQANTALATGPRGSALGRARAALDEARTRMDAARRLLDAQRAAASQPPPAGGRAGAPGPSRYPRPSP